MLPTQAYRTAVVRRKHPCPSFWGQVAAPFQWPFAFLFSVVHSIGETVVNNAAHVAAEECTPRNQACTDDGPECCDGRICIVQDVLQPEGSQQECIRALLPAVPCPRHSCTC